MFKALFIGYLFGVRSERQLVLEIEVNVAYRLDPVADSRSAGDGEANGRSGSRSASRLVRQ